MKKTFLVLLFAFSLFAGESEEIGVPYFDQILGPDSAILSNTTEKLYTLQGDLVTGYQTNPMKKILSFHTGIEKVHNGYRILVTQDDKRIILYSRYDIQLWDIKTKKLLKKVDLSTAKAISSQYGLIVLTKDHYLEILDEENLEKIRKSDNIYVFNYENGVDFNCFDNNHANEMFVNKHILLLRFPLDAMFMDLESLKIIDQVSYKSSMKPYLDKYSSFFTTKRLKRLLVGETGMSREQSTYLIPSSDNNLYDEIFTLTFTAKSLMIGKFFHDSSKKVKTYEFHQLMDEWVFYAYKTHLFTGSENIKKYLQMKMKDGTVVPMNQVTFEKYNQPLSIKAN